MKNLSDAKQYSSCKPQKEEGARQDIVIMMQIGYHHMGSYPRKGDFKNKIFQEEATHAIKMYTLY